MLNLLIKKFWIVVVMFVMSIVFTIGIYEAGRSAGQQDVLFNSEMWVEDNSILIDFEGEVYEHLVD